MKAAGLKAIDTVYESTATLIKSKRVSNQKLVNLIASRINGVISMCNASFPRERSASDKLQPLRNTSYVNIIYQDDYLRRLLRSRRGSERQRSRRWMIRNGMYDFH